MEKDRIYFAESGLTTTSANHIANLCKEMYQGMEKKLNSICFYTTKIELLGSGKESVLQEGVSNVDFVFDYINDISQLKSLIAWLREAIKAKDRLIKEAKNLGFEDIGIEVPKEPLMEKTITDDDVLATWTIKERNKYFQLETFCSVIGKLIHNDGPISKSRDNLYKVINQPNLLKGEGRDAILYKMTPSMSEEDVDAMFMNLQDLYRTNQAQLNSLKYSIETAVNEDEIAKNAKYTEELSQYNKQMNKLMADVVKIRKEKEVEASQLKIRIPDSLKEIYEKVKQIG